MTNEKLPLNVLLTKRCNADCLFCIEKTVLKTKDARTWQDFARDINLLIDRGMVTDVLLLGGEPLYFEGILDLIKALKVPPIITTNGHRLVSDPKFLAEFSTLKLRALNISLSHFDEAKRAELMQRHLFTNQSLKTALKGLPFNIRINNLLLKDFIETESDITQMAEFCSDLGVAELKVGELVGRSTAIHDFIENGVVKFNHDHYAPIPVKELFDLCHVQGGTFPWKSIAGVSVLFNAPPDIALAGGKDTTGSHYHRVLFNDGLLGYSWRRDDGVMRI
jgi:molybdenum cofactor biosynthesis enzyme MoaA